MYQPIPADKTQINFLGYPKAKNYFERVYEREKMQKTGRDSEQEGSKSNIFAM